jgi:tripartite-type tricarboxylate transporter receptor subunit TctC
MQIAGQMRLAALGARPELPAAGGRVDDLCDIITTTRPQIDAGTVKPTAVLTKERSPALANVPTAIEQGFAVEAYSWNALFLPKGRPAPIVQKLRTATFAAMKTPAIREKLEAAGLTLVADDRTTSEYLGEFVGSEIAKWARRSRRAARPRRIYPEISAATLFVQPRAAPSAAG